jgi:hypothetical protein
MEISEINFNESKHGLSFLDDDETIVAYIVDNHGHAILKSFDHRPENTGVALFFDNNKTFKDLVIVIRAKYFKENKNNGLVMFFIQDLYKNKAAREGLIEIIQKTYEGNTDLRDAIIRNIEAATVNSINENA